MCRQKTLLQCLTCRPSFTCSRVVAKIVPTCLFLVAAVPKELWANHLENYQLSLHGKTSRKKGVKWWSFKKILHQTIFLVRIKLRNHVDTQSVKRFKRQKDIRYIYGIKFGMLQAHESKISLRKVSGDTAHLRGKTGGKTSQPRLYMQFDPWFVSRRTKLLTNFLSFPSQSDVWNCFSLMVSTSWNCTVSCYGDLSEIK